MENTAIEWAHHTFNPWALMAPEAGYVELVHEPVASLADRGPIGNLKSQFRVGSEWLDVVRIEVSPSIITAMRATEIVAAHNIVAPGPAFRGLAKILPLFRLPVDEAVTCLPARRPLAGPFADKLASFARVLFANPIALTSLRSRAHFCAAFV